MSIQADIAERTASPPSLQRSKVGRNDPAALKADPRIRAADSTPPIAGCRDLPPRILPAAEVFCRKRSARRPWLRLGATGSCYGGVLFEQKPIGTMVIVSDLSEVARR